MLPSLRDSLEKGGGIFFNQFSYMQKNILTIFLTLLLICILFIDGYSQDTLVHLKDSIKTSNPVEVNPPVTYGGYVDTYYTHDNDLDHSLERFPGVSGKRDEFRLNIAMITVKYFKENVRGNLTLQYGDIPDLLWPSESKYIQEANIGFAPAKNIWIDAGYFITHIGSEGIRPGENTFSANALVSFYEPSTQAGVSVTYSSKRFTGAAYLLNGYNVINDNNKNKSIGLSLSYKLFRNIEIVYNNIGGNESSDLGNQNLRLYNNFIIRGSLGPNWIFVVNNDFCMQQRSKVDDNTKMGLMFGGFVTSQYNITPKYAIALRGEYLTDIDGVMSGVYVNSLGESTGLQLFGPSLGFEYKPMDDAYFRIEGRYLKTMKNLNIFSDGRNYRVDGCLSMGVGF